MTDPPSQSPASPPGIPAVSPGIPAVSPDIPAGAPPDVAALRAVATRTLGHYEASAHSFWEGTKGHDVSQNLQALLDALPARTGLRILDVGCGPGRDLMTLRQLGHAPVGLDGCAAFVKMARDHSGCEVLEQSLFELSLPSASFDGIFANASLFHVPRATLPRVLGELFEALRPGGSLFCSNPRAMGGVEREGWQGERYGTYLTLESWSALFEAAGLQLLQHYLRPPGRPAAEQPWLAMVCTRPP
jgi:SAM-dependent methyltransferase